MQGTYFTVPLDSLTVLFSLRYEFALQVFNFFSQHTFPSSTEGHEGGE